MHRYSATLNFKYIWDSLAVSYLVIAITSSRKNWSTGNVRPKRERKEVNLGATEETKDGNYVTLLMISHTGFTTLTLHPPLWPEKPNIGLSSVSLCAVTADVFQAWFGNTHTHSQRRADTLTGSLSCGESSSGNHTIHILSLSAFREGNSAGIRKASKRLNFQDFSDEPTSFSI